jgi:hypothetical protein
MNFNVLFNIFEHVDDGVTYKSILFTCKDWKHIMESRHPTKRNKVINHLQTLLLKYPDKPWDWDSISWNPNITMEFIDKYPNKPWNWGGISYNKFNQF